MDIKIQETVQMEVFNSLGISMNNMTIIILDDINIETRYIPILITQHVDIKVNETLDNVKMENITKKSGQFYNTMTTWTQNYIEQYPLLKASNNNTSHIGQYLVKFWRDSNLWTIYRLKNNDFGII